ncbi:hypothetical protein [Herbaspirillum seropedicae]|uniref:hypothetical protein n=1 Tax=Herbaspirillum seropedicae TaxID=964 RepID=UPI00285A5A39|nr:hypothetical protein [Herbaspirillum seropedicae]MDR6394663.1 hypothetical protein [Herbaspirillum seropedicae]
MLIKRIDGSTRQLGAPADWDGKDMSCGVLPILDVQTPEGNFMFSAWEPTPPELDALNKGANILLGVRGTAHPVVSLQVAADAEVKHPDDIAVDQFAEVMKAKLADARAKGRAGWQHCDPAELSYMLREHVEKGDPRDVANFCMFLWSLGKPIGDARPAVDLKLTPLNGIQVWIEAYTNPANGPNFMGHGRIVQLLREYLALRKLLAPRTPPSLPETHYNGGSDGSEPLYTADMMHLYALQYASQLALPAGPVPAPVAEFIAEQDTAPADGEKLIGARHIITAAPAGPVPDSFGAILAQFMTAPRIEDLKRFDEFTQDGESYDIDLEDMDALADIGLIRRTSGRHFQFTDLGLIALSHYANPDRHSPAVAQPVADKRAALAELVATIDAGRSLDYVALQEHRVMRNARAALCPPAEEVRPVAVTYTPGQGGVA